MTTSYDAIIVGARIAGAATAALLAQQGARVLLIDRATLPAPTVSCPIFHGNSLAIFERMGVRAAIEAIDAPRITLYSVQSPELAFVARLPENLGCDYAYAIQREVLDTVVLDRVRRDPRITVREGFTVTDVVWGAGRVVGVRGRQHGAAEETLYAPAVVGADGKRSRVARAVGAPIYAQQPSKLCMFYAYYREVRPLAEPSSVAYVGPDRQTAALVFDADAGLTVVSIGLPVDEFDTARKDPEAAMQRVWQSFPELAARMRNATRATPVMGQGRADSFFRRSYGPGWALVGDAGHYIDPVTGQGINNALHSALFFSQAWTRTRQRMAWVDAMAQYQRARDAYARPMFDLISFGEQMQAMADKGIDLSLPLMRAITRRPEITQRYVGMYSGATPINAFMHPANLARLLVEDTVRYELPQRVRAVLGQGRLRVAS